MARKQDVATIAQQAVAQRLGGDVTWAHNKVTFDLDSGGYCARFVRQCHEAALGSGEFTWQFIAPTAREMEKKLAAAGCKTAHPQPGDVVCMNDQSYWAGHIGIYLGKVDGVESIAENTSSGQRGKPHAPGTKISPLSAVACEVSGYYAPLPAKAADAYAPGPIKVELQDEHGKALGSVDAWFSDHAVVGAANVAHLLGYCIEDQVKEARKVVLRKMGK